MPSLVIPGPIHTNMSVSSLTGNGKKYGKMDDFIANGITPEVCAQKILAGVKNGDKEIYVINNEVRRAMLLRLYVWVLGGVIVERTSIIPPLRLINFCCVAKRRQSSDNVCK